VRRSTRARYTPNFGKIKGLYGDEP